MKVLEDWNVIARCTGEGSNYFLGCNAVFLLDRNDLYLSYYSPCFPHISFCCPICGAETDVDDKVPDDISHYLYETCIPKKKIKRKQI